jgi:hypothetical protein
VGYDAYGTWNPANDSTLNGGPYQTLPYKVKPKTAIASMANSRDYNDTGGSGSFDSGPTYGGPGYYDTQRESQQALNSGNNYPQTPQQPSLLETLLGKINTPYQRPDASQMNFQALDQALKGKLGLIDSLKGQTQQNFDKADVNSQAMGDAFKNDILNGGAKNLNSIADQQKGNLSGDAASAVAAMQASKDKAMNDRIGMLKSLGIQDAGAAVDPSQNTFSQGMATVDSRLAGNQAQADQQRAGNLALNNTMAQSAGMEAMARRQALQMQLAQTLGKANMAEMDAKSQDAAARSNIINGVNDQYYKQYKDQQDVARELFNTVLNDQTRNTRYQMQYGNKNQSGGGYAGIADTLASSGIDPNEAADGMSVLNDVLSSGNYLAGAQGQNQDPYDRTAVLAKAIRDKSNGRVSPGVAAQIADNYNRQQTLR